MGSGALSNLKPGGPTEAPRNTAVARMSYGRFLDYVEAGRVTSVDIYDGGRDAVVEAVDPDLDNRVQRLRVDLPGLAPDIKGRLSILKVHSRNKKLAEDLSLESIARRTPGFTG